MNLSLWQNKPDRCLMSKISVIQDCQWFYKEDYQNDDSTLDICETPTFSHKCLL